MINFSLSVCLSVSLPLPPPLWMCTCRERVAERERGDLVCLFSQGICSMPETRCGTSSARGSLYQWSSDFIQLLVTDLSLIHKRKGDKKGKLVKSKRYSFNYTGHLFFKFVYIYNKRQWMLFWHSHTFYNAVQSPLLSVHTPWLPFHFHCASKWGSSCISLDVPIWLNLTVIAYSSC